MKKGLLIEAENFARLGGWTVDPGAIHDMGSCYIMAHGLGTPVEDAVTKALIPGGSYTVYVRTRDWSAPWQKYKNGKPAGRFQLLINGEPLPETLGTNGAEWAWQKAGTVNFNKETEAELAIHDLTGFNGRCDALYFSPDGSCPPNDKDELEKWRYEASGAVITDDPVEYDLIVCGGGMAGTCTALSAYRLGLTVALIQDRPVLGGCNSSEIRVGLGGMINFPPYDRLGNIVGEIGPVFGSGDTYGAEFYEDGRKERAFLPHIMIDPDTKTEINLCNVRKPNVLLNETVIKVERVPGDPKKIAAVITKNVLTGAETRRRAKLFSDCTGDGFVARSMGCEYMYGREERSRFNEAMAPEKADRLVMGMSVLWYSEDCEAEQKFPEVDFGVKLNEKTCINTDHGDWEWETGFNRDMLHESEYIRDYALMVVFANWSFLKNESASKDKYKNKKLSWVSKVGGKRESCRVIGDYILTENDAENAFCPKDATAVGTWDLDQHMPEPNNQKNFDEPFRSCAYHRGTINAYCIPYRSLYARDADNLFLGGRVISVSHAAFSSVRVMRTLGTLGEAVGIAASLCIKHGAEPRDIYTKHLGEYRTALKRGVPQPQPHGYPPHGFETYHFKEIGNMIADEALSNPAAKEQIDKMGINRRYPDEYYFTEEWKHLKAVNGRPTLPKFPCFEDEESDK